MLFSGQPRRHLLTTGWSVFVSAKKLVAGDAFIFLRYFYINSCLCFFLCNQQLKVVVSLFIFSQRRKWGTPSRCAQAYETSK